MLQSGKQQKAAIAKELWSLDLRMIYLLVSRTVSLWESRLQIIAKARNVMLELETPWDPGIAGKHKYKLAIDGITAVMKFLEMKF